MRLHEIINEADDQSNGVALKAEDEANVRASLDYKGLRLVLVPHHESYMVSAIDDTTSMKVGLAVFDASGGSWQVWVADNYQRRGIAAKMYDFAETELGKPIYPATVAQLPDGKAFWNNRRQRVNRFPKAWHGRATALADQWNDIVMRLQAVAKDQIWQYGENDPRTRNTQQMITDAEQQALAWQQTADRATKSSS